MYIETTAELGRRFFRAWQDRGARSAARATLSYVRGRLRLLAGPPARRTLFGKDSLDGDEPPTVSILMATWNRASLLPRAIDSVLAQIFQDWELVIVDDGCTDDTAAILAGYVGDPRIRVFHRTHVGVGAARNFAFAQSNGDIIAYLDSDNEWCGDYLQTVVEMVRGDASIQSTYCGIRRIAGNGASSVHFPPFDAERLERQNFIDLNIFCHRRVLWEKHGGFDADVHRLNDWDLIRRYARHSPPHAIAVVGAQYHEGDWPRITASAAYANHLILSKDEVPLGPGLKVLYLLWHYPQLSESYVETEIARMRRWGVEVEVWSETRPVAWFCASPPVCRRRTCRFFSGWRSNCQNFVSSWPSSPAT